MSSPRGLIPYALLLGLTSFAPQNEPPPSTPFDRVVPLELTADEPAFAEYAVEFDGALHVFARSDLDLSLQVDDARAARTLASDQNSGGGTTPYVRCDARAGDQLALLVDAGPEGAGPATLHLIAAPETEATRAAGDMGREALAEAMRLARGGDGVGARELLRAVGAELAATDGAADSDVVADVLFELGRVAYQLGELEACHAAWRHAARHRTRTLPAEHALRLFADENLAVSTHATGDVEGARGLRESVLAARERSLTENHPDLSRARESLAISLYATGDFAGARALRETVLAHYERTLPADDETLLRARGNLAFSLHTLGELAEARALREEVLAAYERRHPANHPDVVRARANLAFSLQAAGELDGARALWEAVVAAHEHSLPAEHPDLLRARESLAVTFLAMGDVAGARALQEAVLAIYERGLPANHPLLLLARENLAVSLYTMSDLEGARALQEAVLATRVAEFSDDHPDVLRVRENLAATLWQAGELDGARTLLEAVLAARESSLPEDHPALLHARENLAVTMHVMGELPAARELQEAVLAAYRRSLPADHPLLLLAHSNLAELMHAMDDLAGVRSLLPVLAAGIRARMLASLTLAPRQITRAVASENYRLSQVLFLSESKQEQVVAFETIETVRLVAVESARTLARHVDDPELAPILSEAAEVRRELNDLVAGAVHEQAPAGNELAAELMRLSSERDALEGKASRLLAERGVVTSPIESVPLAATLAEGEAAVGYRRIARWVAGEPNGLLQPGPDHVLAHVLQPNGTLTRVDLGPAVELEELARSWRAALGAPLPDAAVSPAEAADAQLRESRGLSGVVFSGGDEPTTGRRLRARVLDPVLAACGADARRLFVCVDDLVFLTPLEALPLDANEAEADRVGDKLRIVNEVSFARLLAARAPLESPPTLLALGGVDYGGEGPFAELPETGHEAAAIAKLHAAAFESEPVLLTGAGSTKSALFDAAPGVRHLHLATHGWFEPESVRSIGDASPAGIGLDRMSLEERISGLAPMTLCGLVLAGANRGRDSLGRMPGLLTAEELCSLDLSSCDLAVLSACETNVGIRRAGQGVESLQAALYAAGARTSISSLWSVPDAATRRLMELFYAGLWREQRGKADALWQAKRVLRSEGAAVRDWAGWVLTGDPD
jgi:tetratricopeptide (TPR) repeat protein